MFTGLIEEVGVVRRLARVGTGARLTIQARKVLQGTKVGDSIAVNGACLTVVGAGSDGFTADVMAETLEKTTLGHLTSGTPVNLERSLAWGERLGGHLVLGHVDGVGRVLALTERGSSWTVHISLPVALRPYLAPKGSVAVDGISLTVAA
ncbi:MAG: riboflavin synthase, partial [Thermoleophilia bacterium]|nr:riboflavin synthase [Thermoleophilia bacterium]